ncbi:TetR/AcrR family transcriptional regulator [Actinocrispum sp. NPDC049592]|uniref:TetR/AcrR family transcriptional regulator n=1 Tax=Actinocrispum sp. NPDC049592 TaxID=3154835 RepID=UPI0034243B93
MDSTAGRVNQKKRTYTAILQAADALVRQGREITMPAVAKAALVSEATAYRYFPDLATLLQKVMAERLPDVRNDLEELTSSRDPVERIAIATEYLLRHILTYESAVRATMAAAITHTADIRPGLRFDVIDFALEPMEHVCEQLKLDLAVAVSAEALFILTDLCGLDREAAIASAVHTATTLTRCAVTPSS